MIDTAFCDVQGTPDIDGSDAAIFDFGPDFDDFSQPLTLDVDFWRLPRFSTPRDAGYNPDESDNLRQFMAYAGIQFYPSQGKSCRFAFDFPVGDRNYCHPEAEYSPCMGITVTAEDEEGGRFTVPTVPPGILRVLGLVFQYARPDSQGRICRACGGAGFQSFDCPDCGR